MTPRAGFLRSYVVCGYVKDISLNQEHIAIGAVGIFIGMSRYITYIDIAKALSCADIPCPFQNRYRG